MASLFRVVLVILAVVNLVLVSLNLLIPLVATPLVGAPSPLQTALIGIHPITNTWTILTGLIILLNIFKPGGGMTGKPGGGATG